MSDFVSDQSDKNRIDGFYWISLEVKTIANPDSENPKIQTNNQKGVAEWKTDNNGNSFWLLPGVERQITNSNLQNPNGGETTITITCLSASPLMAP